jgi:hypothetical protein
VPAAKMVDHSLPRVFIGCPDVSRGLPRGK